MFCYTYKNFAYVMVPKNGCMSYGTFLGDAGWTRTNLFYNDLDLDNTIFFGHVTEPNSRHTRGLAQYLDVTEQTELLDSPLARVLVSGVFDEHCYSINMMMPHLVDRIHWIPLDYTSWRHNNGDFLTNRFFKENGLNLNYSGENRINVASINKRHLYTQIENLKVKYNADYQKIVKNFLEPDIKLHSTAYLYYNNLGL